MNTRPIARNSRKARRQDVPDQYISTVNTAFEVAVILLVSVPGSRSAK